MKKTFCDQQVAVFDDVLSPEQFREVREHFRRIDYQSVSATRLQDTWRLTDGQPWIGSPATIYSPLSPELLLPPGVSVEAIGLSVYPTKSPMDHVIDAMKECLPEVEHLIGRPGEDWLVSTATPYLYPSGTSISWHADAWAYSGAVLYYVHPEWNVLWGGELLIAGEEVRAKHRARRKGPSVSHSFDNRQDNEELYDVGIGQYIMPRPNRMVFIAEYCVHGTTKVTPAAGQNVRMSISGFFVKQEGIAVSLGEYLKDAGLKGQVAK